ncbi:hypothetical protein COLO4_05016 [Corchorus olitorius]|uniref:Uncharacterized protein n=1 Tax=Corchorus olitorius TaxID=93759 RepID=A0A1R3KS78_9ROSI|nr:hypothetical protein COLO4_05016 [Corchorus olitorius]
MPTLLDTLSLDPASVSQDQARKFTDLAFTEQKFPIPISDSSRPMRLVFNLRPPGTPNPITQKPSNPGGATAGRP